MTIEPRRIYLGAFKPVELRLKATDQPDVLILQTDEGKETNTIRTFQIAEGVGELRDQIVAGEYVGLFLEVPNE